MIWSKSETSINQEKRYGKNSLVFCVSLCLLHLSLRTQIKSSILIIIIIEQQPTMANLKIDLNFSFSFNPIIFLRVNYIQLQRKRSNNFHKLTKDFGIEIRSYTRTHNYDMCDRALFKKVFYTSESLMKFIPSSKT